MDKRMISYDMRILSEIALYLETPEDRFIAFLKQEFPDSTLASRVQIIPSDRDYWRYRFNQQDQTALLHAYASSDGALIYMAYAKEIDIFFIRDDGGLKEFLTSTI